ncbi:uncharacterized protein METZ01_LOCUS3361 [marine metagenome]|uniref:Uncharacterized protein n=1 Tax=marine metagenome TaxID=408172 RepID=A0A381N7P2_9ZZZZ
MLYYYCDLYFANNKYEKLKLSTSLTEFLLIFIPD